MKSLKHLEQWARDYAREMDALAGGLDLGLSVGRASAVADSRVDAVQRLRNAAFDAQGALHSLAEAAGHLAFVSKTAPAPKPPIPSDGTPYGVPRYSVGEL